MGFFTPPDVGRVVDRLGGRVYDIERRLAAQGSGPNQEGETLTPGGTYERWGGAAQTHISTGATYPLQGGDPLPDSWEITDMARLGGTGAFAVAAGGLGGFANGIQITVPGIYSASCLFAYIAGDGHGALAHMGIGITAGNTQTGSYVGGQLDPTATPSSTTERTEGDLTYVGPLNWLQFTTLAYTAPDEAYFLVHLTQLFTF